MPAASSYSVLYKKENAHDDPIYTCIWTKIYPSGDTKGPSKDIVITGGLDALVKVWQMESDKLELLHTLRGHTMAVVSVAASPDGHTLASTSIDSSLIIWDLMSGQKVHVVPTKATDVWKVAFSPDGTLLATGSHTGKVVVYGVEKGLEERALDTRGKFVICVAWNHDGKFLSCGAVDGTVCIFDVAQGKLLHTIEAHNHTVRSVAYSPNSKLLVTASSDGLVKVFDATSASLKASLPHGCWALDACFSPDGSRVATAAADGSVRVATVGDWKFVHSFMEHTDMFITVLSLAVAASAVPLVPVAKLAYAEPEAPAHYEFSYSVHDPHTGDVKQQQEARAGDAVHGSYSLVQPDGVTRIVDYSADKHSGFIANVRYEGHPTEAPAKFAYAAPVTKVAYAAPLAKLAYAAPVAKVAYAAPVAKVAYAAPVAKLAYAAPVAKVAYAAPLAQVTFSSPAVSYHH